ncbi:MAG: GGDEF domain-containing protein, partial [Desulfovibrio sp.]|nr:GGDEF domain-containing protein [Desulfovibrio sp.]
LTLSRKDSLTGLANRRFFDEYLEGAVAEWEKSKAPLGLIIFDVDFFKKFNDTYGHPVGDQVLRTLAAQVRKVLEPLGQTQDSKVLAARYGGEEFGIILQGPVVRRMAMVAESVRKAVEKSSLLLRDSSGNVVESGLRVTISVGTAPLWDGWFSSLRANLVDAADKALYRAKSEGRNRTVEFVPGKNPSYRTPGNEPK